jgi:pilus assembly protein CpaB
MTRQIRTLIVVAVAVAAATVASYGTYRALARMPQRTVQMQTKKAVVAAKQMPLGTLITRDTVKVVDWPAETPLQGGFSSIDAVVDRGLITSVVENEPISENKLAPKEAGAGLAPTITQGMRAISVKVNEVIGVAGFVVPGTRVDVVSVLGRGSAKDETLSRVVVSNVQVLSAGTRYDQEEARTDGKAIRSTVVTLMVNPLDADRIALAQSQGELMLTLRHPLDLEPSDPRGIRMASLLTGADDSAPKPAAPATGVRRAVSPTPPPPALPAPPVIRAYTVETIRAAKRSEERLLGDFVVR